MLMRNCRAGRGFTVVELMVSIALLSLLLGLAAPAFGTWTRNAQVRTVSDALQSGLRAAQAEAVRRNRQVVFFLTNSKDCNTSVSSDANGPYWQIRTVALMSGEATEALQCGVLNDVAAGVSIEGPRAVCLNSTGRQTRNTTPGVVGATCPMDSAVSSYVVSASGGDRRLQVSVSLGGQVRMCDLARTQSATNPDGCP